MPKIWSAKNLGEGLAQIFGRSNFWELRYLYTRDYYDRDKVVDLG